MTYQSAIEYIKSTGKFGSRPGLEVISNLLGKMGDPQNNFKSIHIAGTNGKGSTSSYISSVLKEAGCTVGLFTSPPIKEETERIQLNGAYIDKNEFAEITEYVKGFADKVEADGLHYPTEFELFTAVAMEYFSRKKVDFAVLETGMGGRLDATNVCNPSVAVITAIGLDHTQWLGDTIELVAAEKGGIIKHGVPVVLYPEQEQGTRTTITNIAESKNARVYDCINAKWNVKETSILGSTFDYCFGDAFLKDIVTPLIGLHQVKNCVTALTAIQALKDNGAKISDEAIINGIAKTSWPGRFEIVEKKPLVIFDGGHNEQCMGALVKCVDMYLTGYKKILVFSMFKDKDCLNSVKLLTGRFDERIVCEMTHPRRAEAEYIQECFDEPVEIIRDVHEALAAAKHRAKNYDEQGTRSAVVVCGSLNLLEEILHEI